MLATSSRRIRRSDQLRDLAAPCVPDRDGRVIRAFTPVFGGLCPTMTTHRLATPPSCPRCNALDMTIILCLSSYYPAHRGRLRRRSKAERGAAPAPRASHARPPGGAGDRPEALRPPATGSLTDGDLGNRRRKARPRRPKTAAMERRMAPAGPQRSPRPTYKDWCATRCSVPLARGLSGRRLRGSTRKPAAASPRAVDRSCPHEPRPPTTAPMTAAR